MSNKFGLSNNAVKIFDDLYSLQEESIDDTFKRVANEFGDKKTAYKLLSDGIWRPNTPTWLNAGTDHKIFSACFPSGTMIRSRNGLVPIEKINTSDKVLTHNSRFMSVTNIMKREYEGEIYNFDIIGIPKNFLSATEEHPFYVIDKKYIKCLRKNTCNCNPGIVGTRKYCYKLKNKEKCERLSNYNIPIKWKRSSELLEGDYVTISVNNDVLEKRFIDMSEYINDKKRYNITNEKIYYQKNNKINRFIKVDENFMKLMGYYLSEGSCGKTGSDIRFSFSLYKHNEIEYCNEVEYILKKNFGLNNIRIVESEISGTRTVRKESIILGKFFRNIFGNKSTNKKMPQWMLNLPTNLQKHLLIGIFRGDGYYSNNRISLALSNLDLIHQIWEILMRCNMFFPMNHNIISKNATWNHADSYILETEGQYVSSFVNEVWPNIIKEKKYPQKKYFKINNMFAARINHISKKKFNKTVYNMEVDNDHTYNVMNINVHNCYVVGLEDSMDSIYDIANTSRKIFQYGSGVGIPIGNLREKEAYIYENNRDRPPEGKSCLTGDTVLLNDKTYLSIKKQKVTIKWLYDFFKKVKKPSYRIRSMLDDFGIGMNNVKDVIYNGKRPIFKIITKDGYSIKATSNHRFLSEKGEWKKVEDFSIGEKIGVNEKSRPIDKCKRCGKIRLLRGNKSKYKGLCENCVVSVFYGCELKGSKKDFERRSKSIKEYRNKKEIKEYYSLINSGEKNPMWRGDFANETTARGRNKNIYLWNREHKICERCIDKFNRVEVHHKDGNPYNNEINNLEVLCYYCHKKEHIKRRAKGNYRLTKEVYFDKIISLNYIGVEDVYDIKMKSPYHNFIANGFVSHNSGPIIFMKLFDAVGETTKSGGRVRRAAILCSIPVWHPDIMDFIKCKEVDGRLSNMNISVSITDKFMKCLDDSIPFQSHSPYDGSKKEEMDPYDIWDTLVEMAYKTADPGVLFIDTINKYNPLRKIMLVETSNPCIVGDTLIATADGRNAVSIKQLSEEVKDVPLYSTNIKSGKVEIKWGRKPRKTGNKKEVWKLKLDDGSELIATPDHKILTKDLSYVKLCELKPEQSVFPFNTFNSNRYRQVCGVGKKMSGGNRRNRRQYRVIHEFFNGETDAKNYAIHHMDCNSINDSIENLSVIPHEDHRKFHSERIKGKNNPYHKMSSDWKKSFASHPGEKNGRYCGYTNEQLIKKGREIYKLFSKFTKRIWTEFAKKTDYPTNVHHKFRFGSFSNFKSLVIDNHKVVSVNFHGYEDVYNITVDDNNNYHVITSYEDDNFVKSSGLCVKNCGEQPLLPFLACNLSSINLSKFVKDGKFDKEGLYSVAYNIMGLMDNVIDVMDFPDIRFKENVMKYRPVGIGVMGLADVLFELGIKYNSQEGRNFAGKVMKTITTACVEKSADLAKENGPIDNWDIVKDDMLEILKEHTGNDEAVLDKVKKHGVRNSQFTTAPPTGTTAISCDASYGIEPCFGLVFRKNFIDGTKSNFVNPIFEQKYKDEPWFTSNLVDRIIQNGGSLKNLRGIPKEVREVFVTAHDIKYKDRIDMQAELQKYCSTAISSTINLPESTSKDEISEIYKYAYEKGLKGVTIYRDGCKLNQPLSFTSDKPKEFKRPQKLSATQYMVETGNGKMYVGVGEHMGKPVETVVNVGKGGQTLNTMSEAIGRLVSIMLQKGISVEDITKTMIGINSDQPTWFRFDDNDKKPTQILSIPDGLAQLLQKYYSGQVYTGEVCGEICPKCGQNMTAAEGCFNCNACGYSKCS